MLNTEVSTVILGTQRQTIIFKNIHFKKNNKTIIIFKVWVSSGGGVFGKYSIAEKYVLTGAVSILWLHIERRPSAAHTGSKNKKT